METKKCILLYVESMIVENLMEYSKLNNNLFSVFITLYRIIRIKHIVGSNDSLHQTTFYVLILSYVFALRQLLWMFSPFFILFISLPLIDIDELSNSSNNNGMKQIVKEVFICTTTQNYKLRIEHNECETNFTSGMKIYSKTQKPFIVCVL